MLREVGRDLQRRVRTNSPFNPSGTERWNASLQLIVAFEVTAFSLLPSVGGHAVKSAMGCL